MVIIGPTRFNDSQEKQDQFDKLVKQSNVHYLGPKPATALKNYIAAAKLALIPYVQESIRMQTLKALFYIVQYKPIVGRDHLTDFSQFDGKTFYLAKNDNEFIDNVKKVYASELDYDKQSADSYIDDVYYDKLINDVFNHLG
jgi:hypothetical protein